MTRDSACMPVLMMAEMCLLTEHAICYLPLFDELHDLQQCPTETVETVSMAAVVAAFEQNASTRCQPVATRRGSSPSTVLTCRSSVVCGLPCAYATVTHEQRAVMRNEQTAQQIHLHRGVYPFWYPEPRGIQGHEWQMDMSAVCLWQHGGSGSWWEKGSSGGT